MTRAEAAARPQEPEPGEDALRVPISFESYRLLGELAERGVYGRDRAEVAARFIDQKLQEFVARPTLKLHAGGGHPRKLSMADARTIRRRVANGASMNGQAKLFGLNTATVRSLIAGITYKEPEAQP